MFLDSFSRMSHILFMFVCFDLNSDGDGVENGARNYCMTMAGGLSDSPATQTTSVPYLCEAELSSRCPGPGWVYYQDVSGQEGKDSCLLFSSYTVTSFLVAAASCPAGSHLLTIGAGQLQYYNSTAATTSSLLTFALSTSAGRFTWIGCSQNAAATGKAQGWSWIDGTEAGNLNCGSGNGLGCGIWASGEPKYGGLPLLQLLPCI